MSPNIYPRETPSSTPLPHPDPPQIHISDGAKVGIAIGIAVVVLLSVCFCVRCCCWRLKARSDDEAVVIENREHDKVQAASLDRADAQAARIVDLERQVEELRTTSPTKAAAQVDITESGSGDRPPDYDTCVRKDGQDRQ